MAVWLKTHWINRPGVTTWSKGQTGLSNQKWIPVIGAAHAAKIGESRQPIADMLGNQAWQAVEWDREDHEVCVNLFA